MSEIRALTAAKRFLAEADRALSRDDDFGNGQAVSLGQDAAELIARAAVRHLRTTVKAGAGMVQLLEALDNQAVAAGSARVPYRAHVEELNQARISFKHFGIAPSAADARRLLGYGHLFASQASVQLLGVDWDQLSLADMIKIDGIRTLVKAAEGCLARGEYREAMVEATDAVNSVQASLSSLLPRLRLPDRDEQVVRLTEYLDDLRLLALSAAVNFDLRELMRFRSLGVHVSNSASGTKRYVSFSRSKYSDTDAAFAVRFACDFALAVQSRLG